MALNLNILLLDLVLLIYCYKYNHWGWLNDKIFKLLIFFVKKLLTGKEVKNIIKINWKKIWVISFIFFIKVAIIRFNYKIVFFYITN